MKKPTRFRQLLRQQCRARQLPVPRPRPTPHGASLAAECGGDVAARWCPPKLRTDPRTRGTREEWAAWAQEYLGLGPEEVAGIAAAVDRVLSEGVGLDYKIVRWPRDPLHGVCSARRAALAPFFDTGRVSVAAGPLEANRPRRGAADQLEALASRLAGESRWNDAEIWGRWARGQGLGDGDVRAMQREIIEGRIEVVAEVETPDGLIGEVEPRVVGYSLGPGAPPYTPILDAERIYPPLPDPEVVAAYPSPGPGPIPIPGPIPRPKALAMDPAMVAAPIPLDDLG